MIIKDIINRINTFLYLNKRYSGIIFQFVKPYTIYNRIGVVQPSGTSYLQGAEIYLRYPEWTLTREGQRVTGRGSAMSVSRRFR